MSEQRKPSAFRCPACGTSIIPPSDSEVKEFCEQFPTILFVSDVFKGHCKVCDRELRFRYHPAGENVGELSVDK